MAVSIHRFWSGPPDPRARWSAAAIASTCVGHLRDWTPEALGIDDQHEDPRHLSNVARYMLLLEHGGLWLDHDVVPLADLTTSNRPWTAGWDTHREGCAMFFPHPGHRLLVELLAEASDRGRRDLPTVSRSGAGLLTHVGAHHSDVLINPAVLPFDRSGRRVGNRTPTAVHLWQTGATR